MRARPRFTFPGAALLVAVASAAAPTIASAAPPAPRAAVDAPAPTRARPRAFIHLEVPTRSLHVGQAVPVKIRAYFRAGTSATLLGPPRLDSDAFTLSALSDKPAQTQVDLGGVPYLQATWTGVLSPAKPRAGALAIELPVDIVYRDAPSMRAAQPRSPGRSLRDMFGSDPFGDGSDPFADLDGFFAGGDPFADIDQMFDVGAQQRRTLTLRDEVGAVTVAALPTAGQPAGFTGAVGQFQIAVEPPAGELRVGEPVTLTVRATGTGNFDRLSLGPIAGTADLETYPGPSSFAASDANPLTGIKTFTQTLVPTRPGALTIPAIDLPYFDPQRRAYAIAHTDPFTVQVAPAPGGGAADADLETASVRDPAMAASRAEPGPAHRTLVPLFRQPHFWALTGAMALATALLSVLALGRRSQRLARALDARRVERAIAKRCAAMDRAARGDDAATFFAAARAALQARLGASWQISPDAVTAADVDARLGERGEAIRAVFEHADRITYAGDHGMSHPLDHWRGVVRDQLAHLEASP